MFILDLVLPTNNVYADDLVHSADLVNFVHSADLVDVVHYADLVDFVHSDDLVDLVHYADLVLLSEAARNCPNGWVDGTYVGMGS